MSMDTFRTDEMDVCSFCNAFVPIAIDCPECGHGFCSGCLSLLGLCPCCEERERRGIDDTVDYGDDDE